MSSAIRVRDVVRGDIYEFDPTEPALRGSYDLFDPEGPVVLREGFVEWLEGGAVRTSRVKPTTLGDVSTGERVLIHVGSTEEWWLCDVEAIYIAPAT